MVKSTYCHGDIISAQVIIFGQLQVIGEPEEAITQLEDLTNEEEDIGVDEFSVTTILIEAVSGSVEQDRNVIHIVEMIRFNCLPLSYSFSLQRAFLKLWITYWKLVQSLLRPVNRSPTQHQG